MSSYSGEIGLIYRTAYCSSKFAVTGFFEALRMETKDSIFITIICPPTVETNLRQNALLFKNPEAAIEKEKLSKLPSPLEQ
jgi:short-subunit dehydrogenase